jgi:predicted TIM-barrel fold metal-dependent hydrolase
VYADFSGQTLTNYPRAVSQVLREWLEFAPDKVLFATDANPYSEEMGLGAVGLDRKPNGAGTRSDWRSPEC